MSGASLALGLASTWADRASHPAPRVTQIVALVEALQGAMREARAAGVDPAHVVCGFALRLLAAEDKQHKDALARVGVLARQDAARALRLAAETAARQIAEGDGT